jgi:transposase
MRQTTGTHQSPGEGLVKYIKRTARKHYSSEEKNRIVLDGLRGKDSIAELCRREGISQDIYYQWSKDFMEAGKRLLDGDIARAATTDEVKDLRQEARDLKEIMSEQTLELRLLKKSMTGPSRQITLQSPAGQWMGATTNEVPASEKLEIIRLV